MSQNYDRFDTRYRSRGRNQQTCPTCGSGGFQQNYEDEYLTDGPEGYYGRPGPGQNEWHGQGQSGPTLQGRENGGYSSPQGRGRQGERYGNDWQSGAGYSGGERNWANDSGGRSMYRGSEGQPEEFGNYGGPSYGGPRQSGYGQSGYGTGYRQSGYGNSYAQGGYGGGYSQAGPNTGYGHSTYGQRTYGNSGGPYGNYGSSQQSEPIGPTYSSEPASRGSQRTGGGQYSWDSGTSGMGSSYQSRNRGPKGYKRSDERINEDLSDQLMKGPVDASDVELKVADGVVTLTGTVPDRHCKYLLEDLAERIAGVKEVNNEVRIKRESNSGSESEFGSSSSASGTSSSSNLQGGKNNRNKPAYSA
jgi:osmotically-inducible protein OsmY